MKGWQHVDRVLLRAERLQLLGDCEREIGFKLFTIDERDGYFTEPKSTAELFDALLETGESVLLFEVVAVVDAGLNHPIAGLKILFMKPEV